MRDEHARRHTGISSSYKVEIVGRRGGRRQAVVYGAAMLGPDGHVEGIIATFSDVTAIGQLEHALGQSQKMEAIGQLAAGVAHDFNNLLVPILGYSEMLIADGPTAAPAEELRAIRAAALHAKELTTQLLIFARKRTLEMRPLAVAEEVRGFATMLRRMLREDIALDLQVPDGVPSIRADVTQIRQILLNLAANAQDAMPRGGTLHVSVQPVVVTGESPRDGDAVAPGPYVELRVQDTGTGMDEATRLRVFEPFFTTKPAGSGTGLGLAMVYGCVRMHGGHIRCESQPGQGTAFVMRFPAVDAGAVVTPRAGAPTGTRAPAVILVAEDQKPVRALLRRVLEAEGHQVILAEDGVEALARAAGHPGTIDLLVSDVIMPNMGGFELLAALRAERPNIKALFLSGYPGDDEGRLRGQRARFLSKPFQVDVLKQVVGEVLGETSLDTER
jgi:signal transduction histidine kinase